MPSSSFSALALILIVALLFLISVVISSTRLSPAVKTILVAGLFLRLAGAVARYLILFNFYHGSGDARVYYTRGMEIARSFKEFDFSPLFDSIGWVGGNWYGTQFVRFVSAFVLSVTGPSLLVEFIVFSLFAFVGLVLFGAGYRRCYSSQGLHRFLALVLLFPSLWYWPSSVGKEAILVLGLGIAVLGFSGTGFKINWLWLIVGLFVVFAVRPEVAGVFLVSIMISQWLSLQGRWTANRIIQGVLILGIGVLGMRYTMQSIGIQEFDAEGITTYVESNQGKVATGGTTVTPLSGLESVPLASFNVLFRPLPWEATNIMVLLSSMEVLVLWVLVIARRKRLLDNLRYWRTDRLIRLSVVFIVLYSMALGMMLVNLGIIARQRVFLFPFVFLLLEADPKATLGSALPSESPERPELQEV